MPHTAHLQPEILELASKPLKPSRLFYEALQSAEALDESGLGVWEKPPPYCTLTPESETPHENRYTESIVQVMHGKRLRETRAAGRTRRDLVEAGGVETVLGALRDEVEGLTSYCMAGTVSVQSRQSTRDGRMAEHYLEWAAKRLVSHHHEVLALERGPPHYLSLYNSSHLVWQTIVIQ